jgi:hypothetical protein
MFICPDITEEVEISERKTQGKDRLVSTVDEDARWGASSKKNIKVGYKANISMTDHFVTEIEAIKANVHDSEPVTRMYDNQKDYEGLDAQKCIGDKKYGTKDLQKKWLNVVKSKTKFSRDKLHTISAIIH